MMPEETLHTDKAAKNLNVLVAEVNPLNRLLINAWPVDTGCSYTIVSSGAEVLELLKTDVFDIILMELHMPDMDGFACAQRIRYGLHIAIPIIALTEDGDTLDMQQCRRAGMNDFICKPLNAEIVLNKINSLVKEYNDNALIQHKGTRITNLDYLRRQTKSNTALLREMISVYIKQTPPFVKTMKEGAAAGDWDSLYVAVHKIIPSFAIMGINTVYETLAKNIQQNASNRKNLDLLPSMVDETEDIVNKACLELEAELKILDTINN